jgi:hypothetical protein
LDERADRFTLADWLSFFSETAVSDACRARTCGARCSRALLLARPRLAEFFAEAFA